jgi:CBS domain-containing protein
MLLRDVMTRTVEEVAPQASLAEAAQKMRTLDVGALPVCENDRLIGILTDRDITIRAVAEGCDPNVTPVWQAMTRDVAWCRDDEDVRRACQIMEDRQIRRLLVCDGDEQPVGIVSLGDLATRGRDQRKSGEVLEEVSKPCAAKA